VNGETRAKLKEAHGTCIEAGLLETPSLATISITVRFIVYYIIINCLCGTLTVVPGYKTETYCISCAVPTEFIYVM
jgi:hypothetical protein